MICPALRRPFSTRRVDPLIVLVGLVALAFALIAPRGARAEAPSPSFAAAAARIDPSCVGIVVRESGRAKSRGAGFALRSGGIVVTAAHVVAGIDDLAVRLPDGREATARLIGSDEVSDIALLRVAADLAPITPAPDGSARRGDAVAAIGDPLGFSATLTVGHLSSTARAWEDTSPFDFLQHDAALNPGSSGGPLVDPEGRVIGMNVAIADGARRHVGIGLALPIAVIDRIADRLLRDGTLARPRLGARVRPAEALRPAIPDLPAGVVVEAVEPTSAAAAAGLEPGDLLLAADGRPLTGPRDLARALEPKRIGDELRLTARTGGRDRTVVVSLAGTTREAATIDAPPPATLGLGLETGGSRRIAAVDPDTPAETAGLAAGDEVLAIGGRRVEGDTGPALLRAAEAASGPGGVALLVRRGDKTRWIVLGRSGRLDGEAPFGSNAEALTSHLF